MSLLSRVYWCEREREIECVSVDIKQKVNTIASNRCIRLAVHAWLLLHTFCNSALSQHETQPYINTLQLLLGVQPHRRPAIHPIKSLTQTLSSSPQTTWRPCRADNLAVDCIRLYSRLPFLPVDYIFTSDVAFLPVDYILSWEESCFFFLGRLICEFTPDIAFF